VYLVCHLVYCITPKKYNTLYYLPATDKYHKQSGVHFTLHNGIIKEMHQCQLTDRVGLELNPADKFKDINSPL